MVQVEIGALVIINVYVPNGGGSRDPDNPRVDAKCVCAPQVCVMMLCV